MDREAILRRNNVTVSGSGSRSIVLAHGYGCDHMVWDAVVPAFEAEWRVVVFDHVGFGKSDLTAFHSDRHGSLQGYAADALEIMETLDLNDTVFVGHSMAATIGMLAAIAQPSRFAALVMVCPSPRFLDDGDYAGGFSHADVTELLELLDANFLVWSETMAPTFMGNPERPELGETLRSSFCRTDPEIARAVARTVFLADHRADVARCGTRSLVLQTGQDSVAPLAVGEWMHRHLPRAEYRLMAAIGHCPHMSAPKELVSCIRDFVG